MKQSNNKIMTIDEIRTGLLYNRFIGDEQFLPADFVRETIKGLHKFRGRYYDCDELLKELRLEK
jgi:hypothetical protein